MVGLNGVFLTVSRMGVTFVLKSDHVSRGLSGNGRSPVRGLKVEQPLNKSTVTALNMPFLMKHSPFSMVTVSPNTPISRRETGSSGFVGR